MTLPDEFVIPNYAGGTIGNIPATVGAMLGVDYVGLPALDQRFWTDLDGGVRRVVVVLVDAMGRNLIDRAKPSLLERAIVDETITTVFPSTTVNCLSSMWTGHAPAQHGLVGLRLFFPEYGTVGQMLSLGPDFFRAPDALVTAGLDIETFLPVPTVGEQLGRAGVRTTAIKGYDISDSALSKMHGRGLSHNLGTVSFADMMVQVREQLAMYPDDKQYIYAYWPTIDTLSHIYSPNGETVLVEMEALLHQFETILLDGMAQTVREGTVVLLVADHGHVPISSEERVIIEDVPGLSERLLMRMTGEPRAAYLHCKQGEVDAVVDILNNEVGDQVFALRSEEAVELGLWGSKPFAAAFRDRIGDVLALMRGNHTIVNEGYGRVKLDQISGMHGGLARDEMLVPLLGFRL